MTRRIKIVRSFLFIWAGALVSEVTNLTLLGYEQYRVSHFVFMMLYFLFVGGLLVIFGGPSRAETLLTLRRKRESSACTLDRVYLRFNLGRTIRVVVVTLLTCAVSFFWNLYQSRGSYLVSAILIGFVVIACLRAIILHLRVSSGRFGTNEYEARELLKFLTRMYEQDRMKFDPPKGMNPRDEEVEMVVAPIGAEFAR